MKAVKIIECPRDAMQGWKTMIPTDTKIKYINSLLKVGFHTIDFGSFVSPKAIPQMADTTAVLKGIDSTLLSSNQLLAIVANERGAFDAVQYDEISFLGFPFSVSETFQQRNTNSSIKESYHRLEAIQQLCVKHHKRLVVYLSMGFGNPYGDPWNEEVVFQYAHQIAAMGVEILSLADTVGLATPQQVEQMTRFLITELPSTEIGVHLHSTAQNRLQKLEAAVKAGCTRFDGALKGIGGCPMAKDELVGNMDSEWMISFFEEKNLLSGINRDALQQSLILAASIFNT